MEDNFYKKNELSIVVLCYMAGKSIYSFVEELVWLLNKNTILDYEIILVGNYNKNSDDKTPEIIKEIANNSQNIKIVAKQKEGMMGWDMRSGLQVTNGKYITVIDGDGQMPINDLIRVYKKIKEEKLDLVKTFRVSRGDEFSRHFISFFYNILFKLLFPGLKSRDINSKPKIFTEESYKKLDLKSDDWFIDAEIMIQARRHNFKIGEIEANFLKQKSRKSFVKFSAIIEFIKNLIIYRIKEFKY
ncbi:MAG: glycosyltransferase family 2 protein [Candidatus Falkowbacteria bacterium]